MKPTGILRNVLFPVLCLVALASCSQEYVQDGPGTGPGNGGKAETIHLSIEIPGAADGAKTRALADYDAECEIASVDVLQFTTDGKFAYRAQGYNITGAGESRTFKANLLVGDYDLVLVGNARAQVNDAENGTNGVTEWDENTSIQEALDKLSLTVEATGKLTSGGLMPAIPMFGIAEDVTVAKGLSLTGSDAIKMVRMTAKIEVRLSAFAASGDEDGTDNSNFRLLDARLYNQPLEGWVAPEVATWSMATNIAAATYHGGGVSPLKAAYPTDEPILYSGAADNVTDNNILHSIYTFEAPAGSDAGRNENVCLVVGGYYNGSAQPSYYRVDFRQLSEGVATYLPLLRNHKYAVNIKSVTGPGYSDPNEAFYGETTLMEVTILDWNDGGMSDVIFDGQHFLAVNKGVFNLFSNSQTEPLEDRSNILTVSTDVPAGWEIISVDYEDPSLGSGWLSTDVTQGPTGKTDVLLQLQQENITGEVRRAFISIKAGRLNYIVTVVQSNEAAFFITLTDENGDEIKELFFNSGRISANPNTGKKVILSYSPRRAAVDVDHTYVGKIVDLSAGDEPGDIPASDTGTGSQEYTLLPQPFTDQEIADDPFMTKISRIRFEIEHPTDKRLASALLYIYQRSPNLTVAQSTVNAVFTGSTYNIQFSSNADWTVEFGGVSPQIATAVSATSGGAGNNQNFRFSVPLDLNAAATSFTITFKSPTGEYADKVVTVNVAKPTLTISPASVTMGANMSAQTTTFTITTNIPTDMLSVTRTGVVTAATLNSSTKVVTVTVGASTASQQTGTVVVKAGSLSATFNVTRPAATLTISKSAETFTYASGSGVRSTTFTITTNVPIAQVGLARSGAAVTNATRSNTTVTVTIAASGTSQTTGTVTVSLGSILSRTYTVTRGAKPGTTIGGVRIDASSKGPVIWSVANADCVGRGGRLPTVAEYKAAATWPTMRSWFPQVPASGNYLLTNAGAAWTSHGTDSYFAATEQSRYNNGMLGAVGNQRRLYYRCVYP
ncbi:hypothetical protein [uncultured Alistipes sp.]|jgi:hypothetical protein|uniref:hypothetical protein n=1 Tax=uncultured Alistipes sp. TaxID=538949 RepID=UPI0025D8B809|nr:hypothetical protein [uncultured Alistipes sp.]